MAAASARAGAAVPLYRSVRRHAVLSSACSSGTRPWCWLQQQQQDSDDGQWMLDLTDPSHAATRHKTHKKKGRHAAPFADGSSITYLTQLREMHQCRQAAMRCFLSGTTSSRTSVRPGTCLGPGSFTSFVKATFAKYLDGGQAPNPTLLRSIFTTWLYGLQLRHGGRVSSADQGELGSVEGAF